MASASASGPLEDQQLQAAVRLFAEQHYEASGAGQFGVTAEALMVLLAEVLKASQPDSGHISAEEFLLSLRTAEVLRRPKSLAYLQSLKWVAQVKEKVR